VDDDGQVYLQYGGFGRLAGVKLILDGNNVSLSGSIVNVSASPASSKPVLDQDHGTYYNIYARDANPAKIDYATASNPWGRSLIADASWIRCPPIPRMRPRATRGGPVCRAMVPRLSREQRAQRGGTYHRMVAVDKITVNADGTIPKITPTSGITF